MNKLALAIAALALVIAGYGVFHHVGTTAGGTTNYDTVASTGFQVGSGCASSFTTCLGSLFTQQNFGTTTLVGAGSAMTVTASTTKEIDFACANVTSADQVWAFFAPTTTVTVTGGGWNINYARASTTAGFCTAIVANNSGATGQIPQGLGSTTGYRAQH